MEAEPIDAVGDASNEASRQASPPSAQCGEADNTMPTPLPAPRMSRLLNWRDAISNPKRKVDEAGVAATSSRNVKPSPLNRPGASASTLSLTDAVRLDLPQLAPSVSAPQLHSSPTPGGEPALNSPSSSPGAAAPAPAVSRDAAKEADADMADASSLAKKENSSELVAATVTPPQVSRRQQAAPSDH